MFNGERSSSYTMSPIGTKIYMMICSLVKDPPYCRKELYSYYFKTLDLNFEIIPLTSMVYYLKNMHFAYASAIHSLTQY